jgi:hypothetical protein
MNIEKFNIGNEDFIVKVTPHLDKNKNWSGEIYVSIMSSTDNELNDKDFNDLMFLSQMIASSIPLMENDEYYREVLADYVNEYIYERDLETIDDNEEMSYDKDGNIISINFNTKTRGNA